VVSDKSMNLPEEERTIESEISSSSELDVFWKECGKKMIQDAIERFDERAKFMITTCAGLIVINFGLLLGFNVQNTSFEIAPPLFFAISAAVFAISYFPAGPKINPLVPPSISNCHDIMFSYKSRCHYVGLGFFIAGLFLLGVANLVGEQQTAESGADNVTGNMSETGSSQKEASAVSSELEAYRDNILQVG
jgi:hypothetical protein